MIRIKFFLLLLLTGYLAKAQNIRLELRFYPKFMAASTVEIDRNEKGYFIRLLTDSTGDSAYINSRAVKDLAEQMDNYHFLRDTTIDDLDIHVEGNYRKEDISLKIAFNKPEKGSSDHALMRLLFTIMYNVFQKQPTLVYLENLEQNFEFGMGLRKLSDDPLTYKVYGSITARDSDVFYNFMMSLTPQTPTYIDMSNFKSMGTLYYDALESITRQNPEIYWINCNQIAERHLKNAGVDHSKITK